jgi:hypothetical protein
MTTSTVINILKIFFNSLFFLVMLGIDSGLPTHASGALLLEPHLQPFCSGYFGDRVSLFAQVSLNHNPPIS